MISAMVLVQMLIPTVLYYCSPDAIIGLVATAGWNVKEHYADSNRFAPP
jgi:hypothetical protein